MIEVFKLLIQQLNSSVFILVMILIIIGYAVYKLGAWTEKFLNQDKKISDLSNLSEKVIELKTKVDLIYQNTQPNPLIKARSPITLTEKGIEISNDISANEIFNKYENDLTRKVLEENPKNAYDIQTESMQVAKSMILKILNSAELEKIKDEAFKQGFIVENIMSLFGILLRDSILKSRNISIHEVNLHDPTAQ